MANSQHIKYIAVIQSLPHDDLKTGQLLYDDVIEPRIRLMQVPSLRMTHIFFDVPNKKKFFDALAYVQTNAKYIPGGILIHLEAHGSEAKDGLILCDGSLLNWNELVNALRPINQACCNNLFVTMATCYGRSLWKGVNPLEKSPYQAYISAKGTVPAGRVLEKYTSLFENLIDSGDLIAAYLDHEKLGSDFFYKDSRTTFEDSVEEVKKNMRDRAYKEALINRLFEQRPHLTKEQIEFLVDFSLNENIRRHSEAFSFPECD